MTKMITIKICQLIDLAIGFPETGQVDYSALHCLLVCMAEKLGIMNDTINYDDEVGNRKTADASQTSDQPELKNRLRLMAGLQPGKDNDDGNDGDDNEKMPNKPDANFSKQSFNDEEEEAEVEAEKKEEKQEEQEQEIDIDQKSTNLMAEATTEEAEVEAVAEPTNIKPASITKLDDSNSPASANLTTELPLDNSKERAIDNITIPDDLLAAISILKHQIEFVMEQLLLLTYLMLSKKPQSAQMQQLYCMTQTLNELKKEKIPIKGLKETQIPLSVSLDWISSNLNLNGEDVEQTLDSARSSHDALEGHLCYSPAKLLDQLMSLKSDFCLLTNKVNEISAHLLQQESQHLLTLVQEAHKQLRDIKLIHAELRENDKRLEVRITTNHSSIEAVRDSITEILEKMVEKTYFDLELANKADSKQLQSKASLDQILELQCRIDKKFSEILKRFEENDKKTLDMVEELKVTLGPIAVDKVLAEFKEKMSNDIRQLNELLRNYVESTNDEYAAAGARVKVLQDLACLSCDTNCVMPVREKAKVAKLSNAYASNIISPLVTYEMSSIRKSGLMGYYRKDEFPHSPNAWLAQQSPAVGNLKQSPTRHAGGQHTATSAKERFEKTTFNRK